MEPEKIELYYEIASKSGRIVREAIVVWCLWVLCKDFFREKKYAKYAGIAYGAAIVFLDFASFIMDGFLAHFLAMSLALLTLLLSERQNGRIKFFLAFTLFMVRWLAANLIQCVTEIPAAGCEWILYRFADSSAHYAWLWYFLEYVLLYCAIWNLLYALLLYKMSDWIRKAFAGKYEDLTWRELGLLLVPSLSVMACYGLVHLYDGILSEEISSYLYGEPPFIRLIWMAYYVVMLAAITGNIVLYQSQKLKERQEQERVLFQKQMEDVKRHIGRVEEIYREIRGIRHDMGNHVSVLENLLEREEYKEARNYLSPLQEEIARVDFSIRTGNPVTDVLLCEKEKEAEAAGVAFRTDFSYPAGMVDAFDVSVILHNALTNALEASEAGDEIFLSSALQKNAWLITVENTCREKLVFDKDGLPVTGKKKTGEHGLGMKNMRLAAEKYHGAVTLEQIGEKVKLTVLLMLA